MESTYQNPLSITHIGDPFVLKAPDGKYYCYATSAPDGFKAWCSIDLVHWESLGYVYSLTEKSWGERDFWAPEVIYYQGKYIMHYTARWKENHSLRLGVAISEKPEGPFIDVFSHPMFDFGYATIDGHVFIDDDKRAYLYYSKDCSENIVDGRHESHLYVVELESNLLSIRGEPVKIAQPEQEWELRSGNEWRWNEGPFMIKRNGKYYLMYSANFYASRDYAIGYAIANHPLGPFQKAAHNPILYSTSPEISGPGHNSVISSPDGKELFIVYHIHTNPDCPSDDRQICIDRLLFQDDDTLHVLGPTNTPQPLPSR
ncbi:glycoside hydrolase family 43 protein [Anaerolinea thermophila]|uniref:Glycosidase n=1 Tax=Anaerolinea thermophila (strain DSM 14523 / JCM 11388 / NBRC 100420 / UNI-1) TaxID=926569 RepID=E8N412_ANATU|nr:glycoside hydrolase family 43 protein [Anaerolinea thermophila]BAJ63176.1 glycosidase [Anaerolinea thermophila UNI-1]